MTPSRTGPEHAPLIIWRFFDGKAGHRNQTTGLTEAVARLRPAEFIEITLNETTKGFGSVWPSRQRDLSELPSPHLLVGAGHGTHIPMLLARRRFGGRVVVLMKPSLPTRCFDICFVPAADQSPKPAANVVLTDGVMNRIQPSGLLDPGQGLILLGGPSEHYAWKHERVISQITTIVQKTPCVSWTLSTSRRTPADFFAAWKQQECRATFVPVEQTTPDWLPAQLQKNGIVWVSSDSVSMICEARTSGAQVGVIQLPEKRTSRVTRGVESLLQQRLITSFEQWVGSGFPLQSSKPLNESSRCAKILLDWFRKFNEQPALQVRAA